MKNTLLALFIIAIPSIVSAQKKGAKDFKMSVGFEAGFPTGSLQTGHSTGFGGSLEGDYSISDIAEITLGGAYINFGGKTTNVPTSGGQTIPLKQSSYSIIPVLAGCKFHLGKVLFTHPQLGMSFFKGGSSAATFAFGIGASVTENIDLSMRYQSTIGRDSQISFVGIRAAFIL